MYMVKEFFLVKLYEIFTIIIISIITKGSIKRKETHTKAIEVDEYSDSISIFGCCYGCNRISKLICVFLLSSGRFKDKTYSIQFIRNRN